MMEERLPCKKCGKAKGRIIKYATDCKYIVSCSNCGYSTKKKDTRELSVIAWNQREKQ